MFKVMAHSTRFKWGRFGTVFAGFLMLFALLLPHRPALAESPQGGLGSAGSDLAVGDRIKITFFEHLNLPSPTLGRPPGTNAKAPASQQVRSFYQRLDLTGEYTVQLDGSIAIPRMGTFTAAQRSLADVQSDMASVFERTMGRACEVSIAVLGRQPVYVMGAARNPGAYQYVPGMMVLHALALAGGLERRGERSGQLIDILRERERHASLATRLKQLLAQKARLEAEKIGLPQAVAPTRLLDLASKEEIDLLMQTENALLQELKDAFEEEKRQQADAIEAVRREVTAIENQQTQSLHLVSLQEKRVNDMTALSRKGVVKVPMLTMAKVDHAQVASAAGETAVQMARAQQRMQLAERNAVRVVRDRASRITRELSTNANEMVRTERELASSARIAEAMAAQNPGLMLEAGASNVSYEIVRRSFGKQATTFKADEMTSLAPGDILRVEVSPKTARSLDIAPRVDDGWYGTALQPTN